MACKRGNLLLLRAPRFRPIWGRIWPPAPKWEAVGARRGRRRRDGRLIRFDMKMRTWKSRPAFVRFALIKRKEERRKRAGVRKSLCHINCSYGSSGRSNRAPVVSQIYDSGEPLSSAIEFFCFISYRKVYRDGTWCGTVSDKVPKLHVLCFFGTRCDTLSSDRNCNEE